MVRDVYPPAFATLRILFPSVFFILRDLCVSALRIVAYATRCTSGGGACSRLVTDQRGALNRLQQR